MSDKLKKLYAEASRMDRYFDTATPCDLFRGRGKGSKVAVMHPTLIGFYKRKTDPADPAKKIPDYTQPRHPDVLVTEEGSGTTPQYEGGSPAGRLREEDRKKMEITKEILDHADKYVVRGCRTMNPAHHYRGLSLFNGVNKSLPFDWFLIKAGTNIPPGLAVTRDADIAKQGIVHYTVAPKDDMPLGLYIEQLKGLAEKAIGVGGA